VATQRRSTERHLWGVMAILALMGLLLSGALIYNALVQTRSQQANWSQTLSLLLDD